MTYPYHYAPDAEVLGAGITAIFNHYRREDVLDSIQKHQMDNLDPDRWYPIDPFLNILSEWRGADSGDTSIISVGMALIYHIELPLEMEKLPASEILMHLGTLFLSQHRGDVGVFQAERLGERHIRYVETLVWPDDMMYGYIYGAAKHFLHFGTHFTLAYDETIQRQELGGNRTVMHLTWEAAGGSRS